MKPFGPVLLVLLALCGGSSSSMAANIEGVRSYRAPEYTRLVFDLDGPLQYDLISQDDPQRLILNLKASSFAGQFDNLSLGDTPVAGISSALLGEHDLKITLDLRNKVEPRSFTLGKNEQYGDRLVIDLYDLVATAVTTAPVATNTVMTPAASTVAGTPTRSTSNNSDPIAAISASLDKGGQRDIVIAISAGHGGDDPGAIGVHKLQEKQVTLAISREVAALLNDTPGYKAVLIREGD
ncbi:MAG: AMIN domain-containing protein, partial [Pseudomonadota bacterium]